MIMGCLNRNLTVALVLFIWVTCINCNFLVKPPSTVYGCVNRAVTLTWTIESFSSIGVVRWNLNATTVMRQTNPTATPAPQGAYVGRVENGSNSDLIIKSPLTADTGEYQCIVTYNNGTQVPSDVVSVYIYDNWAITLVITEKQQGESVVLQSNVNDPSVQQTWSTGAQGSSITVTEDGVYSLCISGGRAECLQPSSNNCTSYSLMVQGCTGAFYCACPILIAVISSIVICILMWKEVTKKIGGFSTEKIIIIVIFSVVAISIGLGLGLGLREGEENCLNCGFTVGISIALGIVLSVAQFSFVIYWNCKKGPIAKDSKGVTSDRSNGDRARSPTSASEVKVQTE